MATFRALTGQPPSREALPEDPRSGFGPPDGVDTPYLATEVEKLRVVVEDLARTSSAALLAGAGCTGAGETRRVCLVTFGQRFAARAFRRPLTAAEAMRLARTFEGAGRPEDDPAVGSALLTAVFLAPSFLYRSELGDGSGTGRLTPQELATRLAYLATLGPPDPDLTAAAESGRLRDAGERARQLDRLLRSSPGSRALVTLVLEWLSANEPNKIGQKAPKVLSGLGGDIEPALRASAEGAIKTTLGVPAEATIAGLLRTISYLHDPAVQKVRTGAPSLGIGDTEQTGRAGLLMHPLVLAAHSKDEGPSPFQMGVFLREAVLCDSVPAPPEDAAAAAAKAPVPSGLTMREDLERRTAAPACTGCHALFAPLGFAFLPFDPVGRWMRQDPSGKAWELSGQVPTRTGGPLAFRTPAELTAALAVHPQVQDCFARAVFRWAFGRSPGPADGRLMNAMEELGRRTRGGVLPILETLVSSDEFVRLLPGGR